MLVLLDNYDSFTWNLVDYFARLGQPCTVVRNDAPLQQITGLNPRMLVLSPGPGRPQQAGCLMQAIDYYAGKIPVLGICLGHQALGLHYGARLVHAPAPRHGLVCHLDRLEQQHPLLRGVDRPLQVTRYHSLVLDAVPAGFDGLAWSADGCLMMMAHRQLPVAGMQFHPESISTPQGLLLLQNWFTFVSKAGLPV